MAQIVISISNDTYYRCKNERVGLLSFDIPEVCNAIKNGTVLPKGHGRLTDMDEAIKCLEEVTDSKEKQYALCLIDWACSKRVMIEADKEEYESD